MSELHLYPVQERECWTHTNMISVMREIENYVLNSSIALTSAYDKLEPSLLGNPLIPSLSINTKPCKWTKERALSLLQTLSRSGSMHQRCFWAHTFECDILPY